LKRKLLNYDLSLYFSETLDSLACVHKGIKKDAALEILKKINFYDLFPLSHGLRAKIIWEG